MATTPSKEIDSVLAALRANADPATLAGMARYALPSEHALGVPMRDIKALGKQLGRQHALAQPLWATGVYEARILVAFVADPAKLTVAEMDRWCREFDNWGYCDTLSFSLFDQSPHAWGRVAAWAKAKPEFVKRTAFALLWALALHDKKATDAQFVQCLPLVRTAASDERNFVKKAVAMALRAIIVKRPGVKAQATALARELAQSDDATERWVGKDVLKK